MIRKSFFFIFFIISIELFAQKITGLVQDDNGKLLSNVAVSIKDENGKTLFFSFTNNFGEYLLQLPNGMIPFEILVKKYGYEVQTVKYNYNNTQYNFILGRITVLDEVNLVSKPPPVRVKKDTTFYKIENYVDGTELKIEDVLKKLPGISVNAKGEIEFKGKKVEKVLIDGDDFFQNNYSIGTKNISAKMLGSVEAIERYSENKVMKNLENSDKIAINLKIKKGENDFSKSASAGLGLKEKYLYDLNVIGITYSYKTIFNSTFNNIGINKSSYDFINNLYFDNLKEMDYTLSKNISLPITFFNIKYNYLNQNKNFLNSINNLFKLSKTSTLGLNMSFVGDKIEIDNSQTDIFLLENSNLINKQINKIIKKPKLFNTSLHYLNNFKNSRLKIDFSYKKLTFSDNLETQFNNNTENNTLKSDDDLYYITGSFSNKIGENNAIDFNSLMSKYNGKEDLFFMQPKVLETHAIKHQNILSNLIQNRNEVMLVGKKNNIKYKFGIYQQYRSEKFSSKMLDNSSHYFDNDINNRNSKWGLKTFLSYQKENLLLSSDYDVFINKNKELQKLFLKFNPSFKILYAFSDKSKIGFDYSIHSSELKINDLYQNYVFTTNYSLNNNISDYEYVDNQLFNLKYSYNNFLKDYIINLNAKYNFNKNNLNSNFSFINDYYLNTFYYDNSKFNNFELQASFQKLYPSLLSKIKLGTTYNLFNTQSKFFDINQDNQFKLWQFNFSYLSIFKGFFNFGNDLNFMSNSSLYNTKNSFENNFTIFFKKDKNHILKINNIFNIPDTKNLKEYAFIINLEYFYFRKNNMFSITINNLTNTKSIYKNYIGENSISMYAQKIMPIGILLKYDF